MKIEIDDKLVKEYRQLGRVRGEALATRVRALGDKLPYDDPAYVGAKRAFFKAGDRREDIAREIFDAVLKAIDAEPNG